MFLPSSFNTRRSFQVYENPQHQPGMPRRFDPAKIQETRCREAEYQAVWQACYRTTRKEAYLQGNTGMRRMLLREALTSLLDKRCKQGKRLCGTDIELTIERHLSREMQEAARLSPPLSQSAMLATPIVAGNSISGVANPAPDLIFASPGLARPGSPSQAPIPVQVPAKLDKDPYLQGMQGMQGIGSYLLGPVAYPVVPETEGQGRVLFGETATIRDDRSHILQRIGELERQVADLHQAFSRLFIQMSPNLAMAPSPSFTAMGDEHFANMSQAGL